MSGFGGFGGFGQNTSNQQQQSTPAFGGGFGSSTTPGFGSTPAPAPAFGGTTNTGGGLFGNASSGFGGSGGSGGFGSAQNNAFGAKPGGFGSTTTTTGGGLFGGGTATSGNTGFGGFGSTAPSTTTSTFGAGNTGGGLFGGNKPGGFGTGTTTTSTPFGTAASSTPFGGTTTGAFGAPPSTALGANTGECQGTGSVPFQAFVEKEPNSSTNQQNSFQSISFQQPYQKFSPEELRLADYAQGRRYGNQSNQPGAFGSTNFGSFGQAQPQATPAFGSTAASNTSNPFGSGTTGSAFGSSQPQTSAFGSNTATTGGLFGQKPAATGGLFGSQPAQQQQPATGLFGGGSTGFGTGTTNTGFGANPQTTGTSLFGAGAASKPAFSFGNAAPASTGTGFGAATTTTGGFGSGGLFGNTGQQQSSTPFGQQQQPQPQQQQPAQNNPFGGFGNAQAQPATTSLFGAGNQPKPAGGLFGNTATNTGTGLFGNAQPAASTSTPFGGATNTQNTGGLFGAPKPAATGSGLFGAPATQPAAGGSGLFGGFGGQTQNQQQQPQQAGGLFGNANTTGQQKPSLFSQPQQQGGTSLFGNTGGQQQQDGSLFGGLGGNQQQQQQPQAQSSIFGGGSSLFGAPQQNQQNQQAQSLTASINDSAAFGNASLFSNLASSQINNPGPLATPLSSSAKQKKSAALPLYKLNSASTSRFSTPTKRGFGFSYSNYGTPNSVSSAASTPGATFSGSLLGSNTGRSLGKSISTSSLRRSFNAEDSILAPGAFSSSPGARQYGSTGSMKKLVINRSLRSDLFSPPKEDLQQAPSAPGGGILKKRVSFDSSTLANANGTSSPLKQVYSSATPSSEELGYMRPRPATNGTKTNGTAAAPEMEQVTNHELAIVHEEEVAPPSSTAPAASLEDQEPGRYWMKPTKAEIEAMSRDQRKEVYDFTVGRDGVGQVTFSLVDLRDINLDELFDNIVVLTVRSATVYPNSAKKPPRGKGLNVPSIISLQNSWPRGKDKRTPIGEKTGPRLKKHIDRLQKVQNTKFVSYEKDNGTWSFQVDHFTTYALDLDDDDETDVDGVSEMDQSALSAPPDTPTANSPTPRRNYDESFTGSELTQTDMDPDDTFQFRKKKILPGAFDHEEVSDEEVEMADYDEQQSFLDERSVGSQSEDGVEEPVDNDDVFVDEESVSIVDQEMAGSFPLADNTTERDDDSQDGMGIVEGTPGGIMRARMRAIKHSVSPIKRNFSAGNDWAGTLTTTISPQKQDRALLKTLIDVEDSQPDVDSAAVARKRVVSDGRGFATSIDLMNSLFGQTKSPVKAAKVPAKPKGFEWPYAKKLRADDNNMSSLTPTDRSFHDCMRPSWGPDGTLVYAVASNTLPFGKSSRRARERDGILTIQKGSVVSENRDVRFAKFANEAAADGLQRQIALTVIEDTDGVPFARLRDGFSFAEFCDEKGSLNPSSAHENLVWQIASVLFDRIKVPEELAQFPKALDRMRKDRLSTFWQKLVEHTASQQVSMVRTCEEKAIAALSGHRVADACEHLVSGKNYHLATLVAQIGGKESMRADMREQLDDWQRSRVLSEFSQPIRAIYELLAGNIGICDGTKAAPIEDRIESFSISKRFGLDWRQAFGLRLWYGILAREELDVAVRSFAEDLSQGFETSRPHAWYVEQKIPTLWEDVDREEREDLIWGLMKLYAFGDCDLQAIIRPENSQLSPLDTRLSWQLSRALTASGGINYTVDPGDKGDQATLSFASQLNNEGSWLEAVFVFLHLSSPTARAKSIQNHLAQHAGRIGPEDSESFTTLMHDFKIPALWIWEAKALYMRSVKKDSQGEVESLIRAGSFEEAHRTFAKDVAPKSIIEADYETLRTLLDGFRGKETVISEWHRGGEIYLDFLQLLDEQKKGRGVDPAVLERLLAGLPAVVESRNAAFMETVAVETMSAVVAKTVVALRKSGEQPDLSKVLRLPLTEDTYLKHTVELSLGYYRDVMAGGR